MAEEIPRLEKALEDITKLAIQGVIASQLNPDERTDNQIEKVKVESSLRLAIIALKEMMRNEQDKKARSKDTKRISLPEMRILLGFYARICRALAPSLIRDRIRFLHMQSPSEYLETVKSDAKAYQGKAI